MFPRRVRAMALSAVIDPVAWVNRGRDVLTDPAAFAPTYLRQRTDLSARKTLDAFLDLCGRQPVARCAFSAGSAAATRAKFDALLQRLESNPSSASVTYARLRVADGGQRPLRVVRLDVAGQRRCRAYGRRGPPTAWPQRPRQLRSRRDVRDQLHRESEPGPRRLPVPGRLHLPDEPAPLGPLLAMWQTEPLRDLARDHGPSSLHRALGPPHRESGAGASPPRTTPATPYEGAVAHVPAAGPRRACSPSTATGMARRAPRAPA